MLTTHQAYFSKKTPTDKNTGRRESTEMYFILLRGSL